MKKSAFIVTKPLQYINATNIVDDNLKDCLLTDTFYNVDKFKNIILDNSKHWDQVCIFNNKYAALKYIIKNRKDYQKLYIDADHGIILSFYFLFLSSIEIFTYEEGYGSYEIIRKNNTLVDKVKILIDKFLKLENWSGGNPQTKGMYLYQPSKFEKIIGNQHNKQLFNFGNPFIKHIESLKEISLLYETINFGIFDGKNVLLYLTNWEINREIENDVSRTDSDLKAIKPHPHIKGLDSTFISYDFIAESYIPAEILIQQILNRCNSLTIFHEGSFALEYFLDNPKMKVTDYKVVN